MNREIKNKLGVFATITPGALRVADVAGLSVDGAEFDSAMIVLNVGTVTDGVHTPKLEESDTGAFAGEENDVAADDVLGAFVVAASDTVQKVGYRGSKRYVRVFVTVTGAPATGAYYDAVAVLGHPKAQPVA